VDDSACRLFFSAPSLAAHRLYEALRAVFVEGLPQGEAAGRFGFTPGALRQHVLRFRRSLASGAAPPFSPPRPRPPRPGRPRARPAHPRSPTPPTRV
jgi:hypothetical protein